MANFRYIGTDVKSNGKVDLKIGKPGQSYYTEYLNVTPNTDVISIDDVEKAIGNVTRADMTRLHRDWKNQVVWQEIV